MTSDHAARAQALDPEASFIVQAPAGSGKTELLIQRYLKLLSRVDDPETIVALTFTKKAAGEMRTRVLDALREASTGIVPESAHKRATFELARQGLHHGLIENPSRMRVQTIDSLCASITRQMPWLARFGAPPEITEKAADLYREAARNTLRMVADEEREGVHGPLSKLLLHLDNGFQQAERLIAGMIESRDQWLRHTGVNPDLEAVREQLEKALGELTARELDKLRKAIPSDAVRDILLLLDLNDLPRTLADWQRLADLALTKDGSPRKKAPQEFPKERCMRLIETLSRDAEFPDRLHRVRKLPPEHFEDAQWSTMEALVDVLPKAVAHLQLVFRERGRVDFAELSIRAADALGHLESPTDLALALGHRIQHLLVDEFQDTSFTQFDLLQKLTAGWQPCDGRTLFLVGDPMQSIYRFREADVSLFLKARREGIGSVTLTPLALTANFRSAPAIIDWVNVTFQQVLPQEDDISRGAVSYSPSTAHRNANETDAAPEVHPFLGDDPAPEAERVLSLVRATEGSIAILVRSRNHLTRMVADLRTQGIPFQAIEIDALADRAIIQDLLALTFAVLHLADRISWLAILRAPWCGLTLADLHAIAGADHHSTIWDLIGQPDLRLSGDGATRLHRFVPVLTDALANRGRGTLRSLIERTWLRLGGPACVPDGSTLEDAAAYFDLLEGVEESGDLAGFATLSEQVKDLFAQPAAETDCRLQIMTIHKAKGLEFDTVILPGLGRQPRGDDEKLLIWLEQEGQLLLAPMSATGEDRDPIYRYLSGLEREKSKQENARLLYVAATRARNRLHLLGSAKVSEKTGEIAPESNSFLRLLWPVLGHLYLSPNLTASASHAERAPQRPISRLPVAWTLPARPPAVEWDREPLEEAEEPEVAFEWVGDLLRHVGTALHAFLQRIAAEGIEHWNDGKIAASLPAVRSLLSSLGVPPVELPDAIARVEKALLQTLRNPHGRWVLENHQDAASEFSVTGMVDGKVFRAVIDRTFIDQHGTRWIVDFKTSAHEGAKLEEFLDQEKRRYQPQLERYARLMAQMEDRPTRLALYFPLLDAWREWPAPAVRRRQASLFG
jgi:ATP-dependent exoDNAse (exonuclease V) beta subunit